MKPWKLSKILPNTQAMQNKKKLLFLLLVFLGYQAQAQKENPVYDKNLADSLGADEYGMRSYVFVILKTGPTVIDDDEKVADLLKGHLNNINRLVDEGKLVVAGPLGTNEKLYRGLFILNVKDLKEAGELLETDPAIKEKLFETELYDWYGPAALPLYLDAAKKTAKITF